MPTILLQTNYKLCEQVLKYVYYPQLYIKYFCIFAKGSI